MESNLAKREHGILNVAAKAGVIEWMNDKPFEHTGHYGTSLKANRCDFKNGVVIRRPTGLSHEQYTSDLFEIAAWHAIHIHPKLNGFQGYDCIRIELKIK